MKRSPSLMKHLPCDEETYSRYRSRDCGHLQDSACRLTNPLYGRNVQGATAIASQLQELKRPTQIAESFHFVNVIRSTVSKRTDIQRHHQSDVHESGPRDLPQSTQVDVDKVEPHNLEDKVLTFIRNNTSDAHQVLAVRSEYHVKLTRRVGQSARPE